MHLKMLSGKWQLFCLGPNMLKHTYYQQSVELVNFLNGNGLTACAYATWFKNTNSWKRYNKDFIELIQGNKPNMTYWVIKSG